MAAQQPTVVPGVIITMTGTADVNQYRFIAGSGSQCGAGARAAGVSFVGVTAGTPFSVVVSGSFLVELGAAANAGDEVQSDANAKAIPLASGKSNGVLAGSATTGDKVPVVIK